jgi:hypothetical protein
MVQKEGADHCRIRVFTKRKRDKMSDHFNKAAEEWDKGEMRQNITGGFSDHCESYRIVKFNEYSRFWYGDGAPCL